MAGKRTSNPCWQALHAPTRTPHAEHASLRLAIVGIGNEFNGDDAVGVHVARKLMQNYPDRTNLLILDCGQIPENTSSALRKFQPDLVMLVDAADMGLEAGTIDILDPHQTTGFSASSHTLPFSVFAEYLEKEIGCTVVLCAIQPASLEFGANLTEPVREAVDRVVKEITFWVNENQH